MDNQNNTAPSTPPAPSSASVVAPQRDTLMAVLAYIGPLVIVSYLVKKDDPFVKFHIKQGALLLIISVALSILGSSLMMLWQILQFVHLAVVVLAVIGIVNAVQGKEKQLPFIGKFGDQIKI